MRFLSVFVFLLVAIPVITIWHGETLPHWLGLDIDGRQMVTVEEVCHDMSSSLSKPESILCEKVLDLQPPCQAPDTNSSIAATFPNSKAQKETEVSKSKRIHYTLECPKPVQEVPCSALAEPKLSVSGKETNPDTCLRLPVHPLLHPNFGIGGLAQSLLNFVNNSKQTKPSPSPCIEPA